MTESGRHPTDERRHRPAGLALLALLGLALHMPIWSTIASAEAVPAAYAGTEYHVDESPVSRSPRPAPAIRTPARSGAMRHVHLGAGGDAFCNTTHTGEIPGTRLGDATILFRFSEFPPRLQRRWASVASRAPPAG